MKFMKLGSKPGAFQFDGNSVRHVSSDLETDIVIKIDQIHFHLHKFPLLSKSRLLQNLISKSGEDNSSPDELLLPDFPGGPEAFEICAKFCYGIAVTLSAYNVVAARCAAEYLEMTEDVERGNLVFKIEVFLNSSIFSGWKDSIIALQTCESLCPWSENLNIVGRCVDSVATKASMNSADITWSYTYNRRLVDKVIENGAVEVPKDWWAEDISDLEIDIFKRLMVAIKSRGTDASAIGEALKVYAQRWLPESADDLASEDHMLRCKYILEIIVWLLPPDKAACCQCKFLSKLLKVAVVVGAEDSATEALVERISLKLDEASVKDLLIPASPPDSTTYDVKLVHSIVKNFITNSSSGHVHDINSNAQVSMSRIARLVDGYLAEIAHDRNLLVSDFVKLAHSVPDTARAMHDGLYMAMDIYLKEHPKLTKQERRRLCGAMDVKRLTMEASIHAAQNDRLPLRVIVQVLFFEQIRAAAAGALSSNNSQCTTGSIDEADNTSLKNQKLLENQISKMNTSDADEDIVESARISNGQQITSRSMRMLSKLWVTVRARHGDNRSSETSGSSLSPTSTANPITKSYNNPSSRCRRFSVS